MPRVTKKIAKHTKDPKAKGKTVPSIRRDLEAFHAFLRTPHTDAQVKKRFRELFGTKLSDKRANELIKPQRGGMAPLDYALGSPDKTLSTLPYIQRGFGFANIDSIQEGSPKEYLGSTPQMGGRRKTRQRQRGGGIADFAASVAAQPFLFSSPPTILQSAARLATGQAGLTSPDPTVNIIGLK